MTATEFPRTAALAWLAALAALAAVIGWETDWGRQVSPVHEVPVARAQPVTVALLPDFALAVGAPPRRDTVERPVFVPTRRPAPPPAAQEPPKPKIQRGQFVLTGTAVVDKESIAFLREASTGKSRTVRKGDSVNGLTVASIAPDGVVLALGDETEPLALKVAAGPRQTIQPAAAVPAPPQPAPGTTPVPVPGQPAPANAAAPPAQPGQSPEAQSLLERRRAARAAQAAAEASASGAAAGQPPAPPVDPGWADVYRRMQQPRR